MKADIELLTDPLVLRAAWLRVNRWCRNGDLVPEPELSRWRLDPEQALRDLQERLRRGEWSPKPWDQVPYPKKGARLRHYSRPRVEDQVAFMAHMVLLAPIIEPDIPSFVFGHRWYRPIAWNRRRSPPKWTHREWPLLTSHVYLPYTRSHGLYRRVAHWAASCMTGTDILKQDTTGQIPHPDDYDTDTRSPFLDNVLPPFVKPSWWEEGHTTGEAKGWWMALDLQLAYPSVCLDHLRSAFEDFLDSGNARLDETPQRSRTRELQDRTTGYPPWILERLSRPEVQRELASRLVNKLKEVSIQKGRIPPDAWRPPHLLSQVPDEPKGLPTGLAICGSLLNVVLHNLDRTMDKAISAESDRVRRPAAFLRFADDMTLLARSQDDLLRLVDLVWTGITEDPEARLCCLNSETNLHLNFSKLSPEPFAQVVDRYLCSHGWTECSSKKSATESPSNTGATNVDKSNRCSENEGCGARLPPGDDIVPTPKTLSDWWDEAKNGDWAETTEEDRDRCALVRGEVTPFVTTLVERLSDLSRDTLADRFGTGARDRIVQLHELARFEIDDEQVAAGTRRLFAVNRLASAWLPEEGDTGDAALQDIRDSIAEAVQSTPWKFRMWRSVVRAAARKTSTSSTAEDDAAEDWLKRQLRKIVSRGGVHQGAIDSESWLGTWPEDRKEWPCECVERSSDWRPLYISFLRAWFWRALAEASRHLHGHAGRLARPDPWDAGPPPSWWTVRAIPEESVGRTARSLAQLDRWVRVLYGENPDVDEIRSWEVDALVEATLASVPGRELAEATRRADQARLEATGPSVPGSLKQLRQNPVTRRILSDQNRIREARKRAQVLSRESLEQLRLGSHDQRTGELLFRDDGTTRVQPSLRNSPRRLAAAFSSLGLGSHVPRERIAGGVPEPDDLIDEIHSKPFALWEYQATRRIFLGYPTRLKSVHPTIHRLLWGPHPVRKDLLDWAPAPYITPAVGLPVRVAAYLFAEIRDEAIEPGWEPPWDPTTWQHQEEARDLLAMGRLLQLELASRRSTLEAGHCKRRGAPALTRTKDWEIPPHGAFFLPFVHAVRSDLDADAYTLYCDVLLLLTAVDGHEGILDNLFTHGVGATPFEDRWGWRSRIHFPARAWEGIDQILRWGESPNEEMPLSGSDLVDELQPPEGLSIDDFLNERVDVQLPVRRDLEVVRTVQSTGQITGNLPSELHLDPANLPDDQPLTVRAGQVSAKPDWDYLLQHFPRVDRSSQQQIMQQVTTAFMGTPDGGEAQAPELVVLPEVTVPQVEVRTLRDLVRRTGRAVLAGLSWRVLRPATRPARGITPKRHWFVNEAELVVPIGVSERGPVSIRLVPRQEARAESHRARAGM